MDSFILFSEDRAIQKEVSRMIAGRSAFYPTDDISEFHKKVKTADKAICIVDLYPLKTKKKIDRLLKKFSFPGNAILIFISGDENFDAPCSDLSCLAIRLPRTQLKKLNLLFEYLLPPLAKGATSKNDIHIKEELMLNLIYGLELVVDSDVNVFLTGETGSGKTELARYIHNKSSHWREPFMHINCAAIPETLLEAELFGYVKGAFTGAEKDTPGKFRAAGKGTILLDEVGEISRFLQAKLLRVLDDKEYYPLGGTKVERVKARIIAATNKDIVSAVREKKFRQDLYYRLNTIELHIPPLRERQEVIPELFAHFIKDFSRVNNIALPHINASVFDTLIHYSWPGNIRELHNLAESLVLKRPATIEVDALPEHIRSNNGYPMINEAKKFLNLDSIKKNYAKYIYELCEYNKAKTARVLEVDTKTLKRLLS